MRILHIVSGNLNGGAARGAYWLHKGLIDYGIESKILNNHPSDYYDESIMQAGRTKGRILFEFVRNRFNNPVKKYKNKKDFDFSVSLSGFDITTHPLYKWADIIHLHWINSFVNVKCLSKIKKPIIWTLRDMWPMTGGCHYSLECDRFKIGCGKCPQLSSNILNDLSKKIINNKITHIPQNTYLVGISPWITKQAKESCLFKSFDLRTIFNGIDCSSFFPVSKEIAKNILNLKTQKKIILIGSQYVHNIYKGFNFFLKALQYLNSEKYLIVFFGRFDNKSAESLSFEYRNFGFLHDSISLRLLYSAADVFVSPSVAEAFGKTIVESMACETPVVCFDATGPKNIVDHKINGFRAKAFDAIDLAKGIEWVVDEENNYIALARNAFEKAHKVFDIKNITKEYINLYNDILNNN